MLVVTLNTQYSRTQHSECNPLIHMPGLLCPPAGKEQRWNSSPNSEALSSNLPQTVLLRKPLSHFRAGVWYMPPQL